MSYKNLNSLTPILNQHNIESVKNLIEQKKSHNPYHATHDSATSVITDFDHFPYNRYFRGHYSSPTPIVAEREAGFRPRHDNCYKVKIPPSGQSSPYPNHCFEGPCSLVTPCYPSYLRKYSDRDAMNVQLNKACVVQYR